MRNVRCQSDVTRNTDGRTSISTLIPSLSRAAMSRPLDRVSTQEGPFGLGTLGTFTFFSFFFFLSSFSFFSSFFSSVSTSSFSGVSPAFSSSSKRVVFSSARLSFEPFSDIFALISREMLSVEVSTSNCYFLVTWDQAPVATGQVEPGAGVTTAAPSHHSPGRLASQSDAIRGGGGSTSW